MLAILGTWLQICPRILALIDHVYRGKPLASAAQILKDPERPCDPSVCAARVA